jgi:AcrR family transcriptional regulator
MRARATAAAATYRGILEAARDLFLQQPYDDVTLQRVAKRAGVALKTVLRRFGTKERLLLECARVFAPEEYAEERVVAPGDVAGAARVLAARYEVIQVVAARFRALEDRSPTIAKIQAKARADHRAWLAQVFAPYLPKREGARYERRLAALFWATEEAAYASLKRLGIGPPEAAAVMRETLEALVESWRGK